MEKNHSAKFSQGVFNTLAQSKTSSSAAAKCFPVIICGNGSDISNKERLCGRAKRKLIAQSTILNLIKVAEERGAKERVKAYRNTYYCQNRILTVENKIHGKYCKNRFCTLCTAIRKAELINKYLPVIATWEDAQFITLTVKSIPAARLQLIMRKMVEGFQIIKNKYLKRSLRGKSIKLMGIRSLECNFNPLKKTYNPHWHIVVPNKIIADILMNEWMQLWSRRNKKWTHKDAQFVRPVKNTEKDMIEVIKYGAKIFTDPEGKKCKIPGNKRYVYAAALDNIYAAMKNLRLFDRFGFNLPKQLHIIKNQSRLTNNYEEWLYHPASKDWVNRNDEILTGYLAPFKLLNLLELNVDIETN